MQPGNMLFRHHRKVIQPYLHTPYSDVSNDVKYSYLPPYPIDHNPYMTLHTSVAWQTWHTPLAVQFAVCSEQCSTVQYSAVQFTVCSLTYCIVCSTVLGEVCHGEVWKAQECTWGTRGGTAHSTLHTILHISILTLHAAHCTLHTAHCTLHTSLTLFPWPPAHLTSCCKARWNSPNVSIWREKITYKK